MSNLVVNNEQKTPIYPTTTTWANKPYFSWTPGQTPLTYALQLSRPVNDILPSRTCTVSLGTDQQCQDEPRPVLGVRKDTRGFQAFRVSVNIHHATKQGANMLLMDQDQTILGELYLMRQRIYIDDVRQETLQYTPNEWTDIHVVLKNKTLYVNQQVVKTNINASLTFIDFYNGETLVEVELDRLVFFTPLDGVIVFEYVKG